MESTCIQDDKLESIYLYTNLMYALEGVSQDKALMVHGNVNRLSPSASCLFVGEASHTPHSISPG